MGTEAFGYARDSTREQDQTLQIDALKAAAGHRMFEDQLLGASKDQSGLNQLLSAIRPGDTVVVCRLGRLGRSLAHLIKTVNALETYGMAVWSLCDAIDTSSPGRRLVFHVFGTLAEFERALIRERTPGLGCRSSKRPRGSKAQRAKSNEETPCHANAS